MTARLRSASMVVAALVSPRRDPTEQLHETRAMAKEAAYRCEPGRYLWGSGRAAQAKTRAKVAAADFQIEAESDVETTEVGDAADSLVPHVSEARRRGQGVNEGERGTRASARLAAGPRCCRPTQERAGLGGRELG